MKKFKVTPKQFDKLKKYLNGKDSQSANAKAVRGGSRAQADK